MFINTGGWGGAGKKIKLPSVLTVNISSSSRYYSVIVCGVLALYFKLLYLLSMFRYIKLDWLGPFSETFSTLSLTRAFLLILQVLLLSFYLPHLWYSGIIFLRCACKNSICMCCFLHTRGYACDEQFKSMRG